MRPRPCGCCKGVQAITPIPITNRPGLNAITYRVGTYGTFFETMKAALSSPDYPALAALRTREAEDPAIALLDAWAVIADVLTFYQERIANEGYLRTALERQSIINLARLVGYALRPGVSASVYLAYTVDPSTVPASTLPAGSRVQSQAAIQGALPQSFEIESGLIARGAWNNLAPRLTQPQLITSATTDFYVTGVTTNLKPNDPVAIVAGDPVLARVAAVDPQFAQNRTHVVLQALPKPAPEFIVLNSAATLAQSSVGLMKPLLKPPAAHPANAVNLERSISQVFAPAADATPALLGTLHPPLKKQIYAGLANTTVPANPGQVRALRVQASPFGSSAPLKPIVDASGAVTGTEEWPLAGSTAIMIAVGTDSRTTYQTNDEVALASAMESGAVFIRITDPTRTASQTLTASNEEVDKNIGPWAVKLQAPETDAMQIAFASPLPTFKLSIDRKTNTLSFAVNSDDPIQVPAGHTASNTIDGQRTSVSTVNNILINYEVANEPDATTMALDSVYDQVVPGSMVVIERPDWSAPRFTTVKTARRIAITRYNVSARVTQLSLADPWLDPATDRMLSAVRQATISTQDEQLSLAPQPVTEDVSGNSIELGDLYSDLDPGRWLIVQGERSDTPTSGIAGVELVMLAGVNQGVKQIVAPPAAHVAASGSGTAAAPSGPSQDGATQPLPGDTTHSFLSLAQPLSYSYKRPSVTVYGNVVRATHGESRSEVLGSGDGTQTMQQFKLHYPQVTYVPAATTGGAQSTLQVKVNDIPWQEVGSLADAGPSDRSYSTSVDSSGITTVQFGDGVHGMRLPTGVANVKATYRSGIGTPGNVDGGKITMLASRPLGVKSVTNPMPSAAGADSESTDQGRENAPIAVASLDRLVSIQDYANFALTYAAIGKAHASRIVGDHCQLVYVTVAGSEGTLLDETSDPFLNLSSAFQQLGDPHLALQIGIAEFMLLVMSAQVQLQDGNQWADIAPKIRTALLAAFGFDQRKLGQPVYLSEVSTAIQQVVGVAFVRVATLNTISECDTKSADHLAAKLAELATRPALQRITVRGARLSATGSPQPAQVAYLSADLPDTLLLVEVGP